MQKKKAKWDTITRLLLAWPKPAASRKRWRKQRLKKPTNQKKNSREANKADGTAAAPKHAVRSDVPCDPAPCPKTYRVWGLLGFLCSGAGFQSCGWWHLNRFTASFRVDHPTSWVHWAELRWLSGVCKAGTSCTFPRKSINGSISMYSCWD